MQRVKSINRSLLYVSVLLLYTFPKKGLFYFGNKDSTWGVTGSTAHTRQQTGPPFTPQRTGLGPVLPKAFRSAPVVMDSPRNTNVRRGAGFPQSTLGLPLLSGGSPSPRLKPRAWLALEALPIQKASVTQLVLKAKLFPSKLLTHLSDYGPRTQGPQGPPDQISLKVIKPVILPGVFLRRIIIRLHMIKRCGHVLCLLPRT